MTNLTKVVGITTDNADHVIEAAKGKQESRIIVRIQPVATVVRRLPFSNRNADDSDISRVQLPRISQDTRWLFRSAPYCGVYVLLKPRKEALFGPLPPGPCWAFVCMRIQ